MTVPAAAQSDPSDTQDGTPATSITAASATAASTAPATGRTVLLHFACHAPLPIGSTLRVTSSQLWAPPALTPTDPTDAHAASARVGDAAFHSGTSDAPGGSIGVGANNVETEDTVHGLDDSNPNDTMYASSVEMGTTPDTYPLWRTRTPVVTILRGTCTTDDRGRRLQHHRYRYLVVTPGVDEVHLDEIKEEHTEGGVEGQGAATTDDEGVGGLQVMMWEDPFADDEGGRGKKSNSVGALSALSLGSVRRNCLDEDVPRNLADLPFRTFDIVARPAAEGGSGVATDAEGDATMDEDGSSVGDKFTEDGIRIDTWQSSTDVSFRPFAELRTANRKNKNTVEKLQTLDSDMTDFSEDNNNPSSGTASPIVDYAPTGFSGPSSVSTSPSTTTDAAMERKKPSKQRIFFVCFHLPVIVTKDPTTGQWSAVWSESLMARTEGSDVVRRHEAHWIGTVTTEPPITSNKDREAVRSILGGMDCTPLFLEDDVCRAHYYGMCKQVLWPALHNVDLLDIKINTMDGGADKDGGNNGDADRKDVSSSLDQSRISGWWDAYLSVNRSFADAVSAMYRPNDIMWIHDYHLCLLPQMLHENEYLRYGRNVTKKVFFLHIPFCSSMIFKELECGDSILTGMLHADVVGFHSFDHARHFLSAAKRCVGVNYESLIGGLIGMRYRGRTVLVTMHNVSVEPHMVDAALALPSVESNSKALLQKHQDRTIIVGIDIAQKLSGISNKLLAYERLLLDYPVWKSKTVLIQRCLIPGSRRADEQETLKEVRYLVERIRHQFGEGAIDYEEHAGSALPMDQRLALWTASGVFIDTCLKEGLNMQPLEYIYARKNSKVPGVIIASEFSAVVSILNGALRINPFDPSKAASIIDKAMTMDMQEREGRCLRDIDFVSASPSSKWTANVLNDLNEVMNGGDEEEDIESRTRDTAFSTAAFLARENALAFNHLDSSKVLRAYNATSKRVIIVDFNGTIVIKESAGKYLKREILGASGYKPPASVHKALTELCADPCNTVFVVSGDSQQNVENAVGNIPGLGLAASNGVTFSRPLGPGETKRAWHTFDLGVDWDAVKRAALPIMSRYTARTNGSFVKLTHSSLGWSYYSCDPEWGLLQASHLVLELEDALGAFDVRFVTLKGIIEIVPRRLNKGLIVKKVLRDVAARKGGAGVDFILCMGDDISDEKMFTSVFSYVAELHEDPSSIVPSPDVVGEDSHMSTVGDDGTGTSMEEDSPTKTDGGRTPMYTFTATVGKKPSHASHYVNDARYVASLLVTLSGGEMPSLHSTSVNDADGSMDLFS